MTENSPLQLQYYRKFSHCSMDMSHKFRSDSTTFSQFLTHFYFSFFIWGRSYLYFLLYPQNTWNHLEGSVGIESSLLFLRIRIFLKQKITLLGSIKHLNSLLIYFFLYFPLLSSQQVRHLTIFFPSKATPIAIINSGAGKLPLSSCTV